MTDITSGTAPAGWYPTRVQGRQRYWDGVRWTEMYRQAPLSAPTESWAAPSR